MGGGHALACSSATGAGDADFRAQAVATGLRLENPTDQTIYYTAFEHVWGTQGLFPWAPCTDAPQCPSISPGGSTVVPFSEIAGYTRDATRALVYYWHLVPDAKGGYRMEDMQSVVVPL